MQDTPATPAKKVHWATQRRLDIEAAKPKLAAHLAGLGPKTCATACSPEKGCAITGDMCGHPYQSGLQAAHMMRPDVVRRHAEAVAHLEHLAIDRKTG